jgi:hypothetical protein
MKIYEIAEVEPGEFAVGYWRKRWFRAPVWQTTIGRFESVEKAKEHIERYEANYPTAFFPRAVCMGFVAKDGRFHPLREPTDDR